MAIKYLNKAASNSNNGAAIGVTIVRLRIEQLFGLYTYEIPSPESDLNRIAILYGENGLGKTNILKILFHLLSPAPDLGHRTALGRIKFRSAEVMLSNDVVITASRKADKLDGAMRLTVHLQAGSSRKLLGAWDWFPDDDPNRDITQRVLSEADSKQIRLLTDKVRSKDRDRVLQSIWLNYLAKESNPLESETAFLRALKENVPELFFLSAERILSSDQVPREAARPSAEDVRPMRADVMVTRGRERALLEAITLASRQLSRLGVSAARKGSGSMHSIYQDLIRRLVTRGQLGPERTGSTIDSLVDRLRVLSEQYERYSTYGLAPRLHADELIDLLKHLRASELLVASEILEPYVESLGEQANSFDAAYSVVDRFVSTVNHFLYDKVLSFSLGDGITLKNKLGTGLEPSDLSSGEQQLLLLFCHITVARDRGGIFIIDEPEISLNIKWQRQLVDALSLLDGRESLQFILASHSMEILTRHGESVIPLQEARDA